MDNKTLENLANAIEQLNQQYDSTYTAPEAIEALTKTISSFNITISDWNILVTTLSNHGITLRNIKDIMPKLLEHLNPKTHVYEQPLMPNAFFYNLGFENFDEVKNIDTIIWKNPKDVTLENNLTIRAEDIIFVKQCQSNEPTLTANSHIVFTAIVAGYYTHGGTSSPTLFSLTFYNNSELNVKLDYKILEFTATNTWYSNSNSNLESTNVQDAIDELASTSASKEYVDDITTNILEVAEGKSDAYVLSCFDNLSTCKESLGAFYVYNYETKEWENKKDKLIEGYFDSYTIINNKFFSEEDYIAEAGNIYLILRSIGNHIVPIDGGYYRTRDYFLLSLDNRDASQTLPKVGDIFLITENGVPDRWYGGGLSPAVFYTLESRKIDLDVGALENGTGTNTVQMKQDGTSGVFNFTDKNPNATAIDETLTGDITYGATGNFATVVGGKASAQGKRSMAQGTTTIAKGDYSHAEGNNSVALGVASHTEGTATTANGYSSHAEGHETQALANAAHAEGYGTIASGNQSHAEGNGSTASGTGSHATGNHTQASGHYSSTAGSETIAAYSDQFVVGRFNNNRVNTLFEVGNGEPTYRTNAFEVFDDGHAEVLVQGMQDRAVATKAYVDEKASEIAELNNEITDLKNALYGSILDVQPQTYDNVGVAVIDRANGYPVVSNQKAQVVSIKGKSLVVNQLIKNGNFATSDEWRIITTEATATWGANKLTITTTRTGGNWTPIYQYINGLKLNNQYYLKIKYTKSSNCALRLRYPRILTISEDDEYIIIANEISEGSLFFQVQSTDGQEATLEFTEIKFVDLTKALGPGNEPTTIEEFRKATIGFDFDTYNEGTLTSTEISKFMVNPFNAFDGDAEQGTIDTSTGQNYPSKYAIRSKNFIPVVCGETYTFPYTLKTKYPNLADSSHRFAIFEYDKNKSFISYTNIYGNSADNQWIKKLSDKTCFIRFYTNFETVYDGDICIHLTGNGAFNGTYRPHIAPTEYPIPTVKVSGVGTVQDEITETELKKVISSYTFTGNETIQLTNWQSREGTYAVGFSGTLLPNLKHPATHQTKFNASMADLPTVTYNEAFNNTIGVCAYSDTAYSIFIRVPTSIATDNTTLLQWLAGKTIYYELATPITLKKKTTAKFDLGTPNWAYEASTQRFYTKQTIEGAKLPANADTKANIMCSLYQTGTISDVAHTDNTICLYKNGSIYVKDTSCSDVQSFLAKISGTPFYYETAQEVTETVDELFLPEIILEGVERGGTVATDSNGDVTLTHVVYKPIQ